MSAASSAEVRKSAPSLRSNCAPNPRKNCPAERRQSELAERRELIRRLVAAAPPVTAEQASELRRLRDLADRAALRTTA